MLLSYAPQKAEEGIYLYTKSNGKLLSKCLRVNTKACTVLNEMLFADDAFLTTHTEHGLQKLINHFNQCL